MDNIIRNLRYLREGQNTNIILFPGYCCLHKEIHYKLECASYQDAVSNVLAQIDQPAKIVRDNRATTNCDLITNIKLEINSKDVEIYGAALILKVAKNCGDA